MRYYAVRALPQTHHYAFLLNFTKRHPTVRLLVIIRYDTMRHPAVRVVTYTRHYAFLAVLAIKINIINVS